MTLGAGEIAALLGVSGFGLFAVVIALSLAMWWLRRTVTMVKRLVIAGLVLVVFGVVAVGGASAYVAFRYQQMQSDQRHR
jgi:hypothetical protein